MLTRIDELTLHDHWYLTPQDECYFIGEYTARQGYDFSATNQFIHNLKKGIDRQGKPEWQYKEQAIARAAFMLKSFLNEAYLEIATFVPVPPCKLPNHPLYDSRMTDVLRQLGPTIDVRELVLQIENTESVHNSPDRPGPNQLYGNYMINEALIDPPADHIAIVDDVLTTGAHFKAVERILRENFPGAEIAGFFLARRVLNTA